jgi:hypothetical protein
MEYLEGATLSVRLQSNDSEGEQSLQLHTLLPPSMSSEGLMAAVFAPKLEPSVKSQSFQRDVRILAVSLCFHNAASSSSRKSVLSRVLIESVPLLRVPFLRPPSFS